MGNEAPARPVSDGDRESTVLDVLRDIEEQGRQTLELVKALVGLLLPKEGGREGPSLEDLLAALVAQQRDLLRVARVTQTDVRAIDERLGGGQGQRPNGSANGDAARS